MYKLNVFFYYNFTVFYVALLLDKEASQMMELM